MTDYEIIASILDRAGISFAKTYDHAPVEWPSGETFIIVYRGYNGFFTEFSFNEDGSLKDLGAYE